MQVAPLLDVHWGTRYCRLGDPIEMQSTTELVLMKREILTASQVSIKTNHVLKTA